MTDFSNRPRSLDRAAVRASLERQVRELDELLDLPAGHPRVLELFFGRPCPVPADLVRRLAEATADGTSRERSG